MVVRKMPRIQKVVLPILRTGLNDPSITVGSWVNMVDARTYPIVNVRRLGGLPVDIDYLDRAVIEMTVYHDESLTAAEDLYADCRQVLWNAVKNQTVVADVGHLSSYRETLGPTQFDSPFDGTWRIQGLIQLGLRPRR